MENEMINVDETMEFENENTEISENSSENDLATVIVLGTAAAIGAGAVLVGQKVVIPAAKKGATAVGGFFKKLKAKKGKEDEVVDGSATEVDKDEKEESEEK